jgi:signal transduction histidine kinase
LQETIARMASAYPATVRLALEVDETLEPRLADDVVAIVTESLSNALRHASADAVDVGVSVGAGKCEIVVSDDGKGFDTNAPTAGMGLENLRSRVTRRGGELGIRSSTEGTEVSVSLPT